MHSLGALSELAYQRAPIRSRLTWKGNGPAQTLEPLLLIPTPTSTMMTHWKQITDPQHTLMG